MIRIGAEPFSNTTMEEKLENLKVHCPDCPLPHNLSSKAIEQIIALFQETIEQAMPEKWKNVMGMSYRIGYNEAIEEYRENLLKAIGEAGEK